jgi:hypothetical protein
MRTPVVRAWQRSSEYRWYLFGYVTVWLRYCCSTLDIFGILRAVSTDQQTGTCCKSGLQHSSTKCTCPASGPALVTLRRVFFPAFRKLAVRHPPIGRRLFCKAECGLRQKPRKTAPLVFYVAIQVFTVCPLSQIWIPARRTC